MNNFIQKELGWFKKDPAGYVVVNGILIWSIGWCIVAICLTIVGLLGLVGVL